MVRGMRWTLVWGMAVASMLAATTWSSGQTVKEAPKEPAKPGLYFESVGEGGKTELVRLEGSRPANVGGGGMMVPFKKPKITTTLSGERSSRRLLTERPAFVFVLGAMSREQMMEDPMRVMDAPPAIASTPKDFVLAVLTVAEGARSAQSGSGGLRFQIEPVAGAGRTFRVTPDAPLPAGEYGFYFAGKGMGMGSGIIWDFGVDPAR